MFHRSWSFGPARLAVLSLLAAAAGPSARAHATIAFSQERVISATAAGVGRSIAVDLDRDGDLDVVATLDDVAALAWYENDGNQVFTLHTLPSASPNSTGVAAADLDADGDIDLASTSSAGTKVSWWENLGSDVLFERPLSDLVAVGWSGLALGDLDGDGDTDLVVSSFNDDRLAWFENLGNGNFDGQILSSTILGADEVATADIDDDGDLDLLTTAADADTISWFENNGDAVFAEHPVSTSSNGAADVGAADVDGDGDLDVISASSFGNTVAWHENSGTVFIPQVVSTNAIRVGEVDSADLDADGDMDLLSASINDDKFAWYENVGSQIFLEQILSTGGDGAKSLVPADLDGDGDLDLLAASKFDNTLAWYENLSPRSSARLAEAVDFGTGLDGPSGIDAGDLDGDGKIDVVAAGVIEDAILWYRDGIAAGPQAIQIAQGAAEFVDGVNSVELFDFDRDGDLDILSAAAIGDDVAWHENVSIFPPTFDHHVVDATADGVRHATAADLDGDGDLDIVAAVRSENAISWYRNNGSGTFATGILAAGAVLAVRSVSPGDLDGDGDVDIAFAEGSVGLGWLENNGAALPTFTRRTIGEAFPEPFWVRIADFDGDGRPDLLATSVANDKVAWLRNMGGAPPTFLLASVHSNLLGAAEVEPADLDGDGDLDFLVAARDADRIFWFENPGPLQFPRFRPLPPVLDGVLYIAVADFDDDGTLDLAVANESGDTVSFLANVRALFWDDFERGDRAVWSVSVP